MKIKTIYYAQFQEKAQKDEEVVETGATTVRELYRELQQTYHFELEASEVLVAVNDEYQNDLDQPLQPNDSIVFLHPLSGG